MEITIQYTGQLAGIVGVTEETVEVEAGMTLPDLIDSLCKRHGANYEDLLLNESKTIRPSTLVIVDDEQIEGDPADLVLDGVKCIMLMTPIAGG